MQRIKLSPRADWQARAEAVGFTWNHVDGQQYWDEGAAYEFSLAEIEEGIEAPTEELHSMCLDLVDEAVQSERLMTLLEIPEAMRDYVADSWKRNEPSLYGRFDFAYDGTGPAKLYEYNADTPTSIFETGAFQWLWLEDQIAAGVFPEDTDQFNSLQEKLVERFRAIFPDGGFVHFSSDPDYVEDRQTVLYLEDLAKQAGLDPQFVAIGDIGLNEAGRFVDHENYEIGAMFKLYPWEEMLRDDYAEPLPNAEITVLEPAWKSLLSNKGILPLLWERHAGHPNLLEAWFESDPAHTRLGSSYVRKPLFSREGANVELVKDGRKSAVLDGGYGDGAWIRQALHAPPKYDNRYVIIGSWVVGNEAAGIGLREDRGRITRNGSRFVPHVIRG
ncbi:glutathionylspermidine synthase family protein [Brevundimonas goettingensis]|uniref:Glutathionylspermidine synthase family protein n=1 Tax=Brevundimonas goettingensis TaxID=2774190 RepID=A0A975GV17_9CAUL|nr:glutathionylspermidine synthase family protein [Brevundimonas goettingensis]QTC90083.1 glutathionylspermidine synthase family protein [Brevundimonas goettingensis]